MPLIGITASKERSARRYAASVESRGGAARLLLPHEDSGQSPDPEQVLDRLDALMLTGGPDVHPSHYGEEPDPDADLELHTGRDALELPLLKAALQRDMPVLCICRGMQVLNVALGGRLIQDLPGHKVERQDGEWVSARHQIYLSPGSKLAAIAGMGGFFRVNSRHHQGLREPQRSPHLLTTAYSIEDGIIEAVELPGQRWVIGIQWHLERENECPPSLRLLFDAFVERADLYASRHATHHSPGSNGRQ